MPAIFECDWPRRVESSRAERWRSPLQTSSVNLMSSTQTKDDKSTADTARAFDEREHPSPPMGVLPDEYTNIEVGEPSVDVDFSIEKLTPHLCRLSDRTYKQGLQFRSVPLGTGDGYRSARLTVRGPLATGRYRQNRSSVVDFGCRRSIEGEIDRWRSIEGEKGKKKKRKRRKNKEEDLLSPCRRCPCVVLHGRFFSRARRKIEATSPW
ncbi:hypothetical protein GW17_00022853 [Ensete ventricosum]|nr:hypothetical protein GW17_00022853 [Ensete ventricosum]